MLSIAEVKEFFRSWPPIPVKKADGSLNPDWRERKAILEDRYCSEEEQLKEVEEEDKVIDEMIGLRPTPQYPLPGNEERVFSNSPKTVFYRYPADDLQGKFSEENDFKWG